VATTFLTEVSSNTAVANIILPVLAQMVKWIILVLWNLTCPQMVHYFE
jgi:di/tricarboxylate transporter